MDYHSSRVLVNFVDLLGVPTDPAESDPLTTPGIAV